MLTFVKANVPACALGVLSTSALCSCLFHLGVTIPNTTLHHTYYLLSIWSGKITEIICIEIHFTSWSPTVQMWLPSRRDCGAVAAAQERSSLFPAICGHSLRCPSKQTVRGTVLFIAKHQNHRYWPSVKRKTTGEISRDMASTLGRKQSTILKK